MNLRIATLISVFCCSGLAAANNDDAALEKIVDTLGKINGRALACSYPEVVNRTKSFVINRVTKTRALGEIFENATQAAYLEQGKTADDCPPQKTLSHQLDTASRGLGTPGPNQLVNSAELPETGINPRYLLQAANGRAIMDSDFPDRFQLITFGYTFCPDICPTTLLDMAAILKQLGDQAGKVQALFITVDPARDTLAHLRAYTGFFDSRILGVAGSEELIKRAAANFKVRYEKVQQTGGSSENYAVDHSSGMFLLTPGGQFLAKFPYGTPATAIATRLKEEIDRRAVTEPAPVR